MALTIKHLRAILSYNQTDFSKILGVCRKTLVRMENIKDLPKLTEEAYRRLYDIGINPMCLFYNVPIFRDNYTILDVFEKAKKYLQN